MKKQKYAADDVKFPRAVDGDVGFGMLDDYRTSLIWKRRRESASIREVCRSAGKANERGTGISASLQVF